MEGDAGSNIDGRRQVLDEPNDRAGGVAKRNMLEVFMSNGSRSDSRAGQRPMSDRERTSRSSDDGGARHNDRKSEERRYSQ